MGRPNKNRVVGIQNKNKRGPLIRDLTNISPNTVQHACWKKCWHCLAALLSKQLMFSFSELKNKTG